MRLAPRLLLPALCLLAFLVRTPLIGLPLEGPSARLAASGAVLAERGGFHADGEGPLVPLLIAAAASVSDISPTAALRWLDILAAMLLVAGVFLLALRMGLPRRRAALTGVLVALHPLGLVVAGGLAPGAGTVAAALVVGSLLLLTDERTHVRRSAVLPLILLTAAHAGALAFVIPLLVLYARREPGPRMQTLAVLVVGVAFFVGPVTWITFHGEPALGAGLGWLAVAALGLLLPGVPGGLRALAHTVPGQVLIAGSSLALVGWACGLPFPTLAVLPLIVAAGLTGLATLLPRYGVRVASTVCVGAVVASLWLVSGEVQAALAPQEPPTAGRLHFLREAVRAAADAAGEQGWIVLAVAEDRPEEQASLADLNPGHWTWAPRRRADDGAYRRLAVFPAASFDRSRHVAVVARAGEADRIETFGGASIYTQELVRRIGPYVVLRAQRP